ncbi:BCCT family transporter [Salinisphaera sp. SPP-AMP-43]|uniref:BCCT family transporter n=1 Tax=Salinisphaera sp. SPP-AMP-43 TaxID=3121288 RepID=UPI003C6E3B9F
MPDSKPGHRSVDKLTLVLTVGFVLLFLAASLIDLSGVSDLISAGFSWTAQRLGPYFEWLLLATFFIALAVAASPAGRARIGRETTPDFSTFQWLSIIMCTLLAGGGVFFAAGEPVYHFLNTPPAFDGQPGTQEAVPRALAQAFMHWGFLAWAILGSLTAIVLARAHYDRGQPLQPRQLLAGLLGPTLIAGPVGSIIDAVCVIAVVAGTVGPIGFLATQVGYGLHVLIGTPAGLATQLTIVAVLGLVYVTSAVTGLARGIQWLSRFNVILALVIAAVILVFGATSFLINAWSQAMGTYIASFFSMATQTSLTAPESWLKWWTIFFFAWFIGYGPLMAIFVARISRGRTIRQMIVSVAVLAPIATTIWYTLLGGSGIHSQMLGQFDLTEPLSAFKFDVATLTVAQALPGGLFMALAILLLTSIFVATTGDSMSYAIAVVHTGSDDPPAGLRAFWGILMAAMAAVLLTMGHGQISALQQFIVITAIPVSIVLLPSLWTGPQAAYAMAREQGVLGERAAA